MNKIYVSPKASVFTFEAEAILAASLPKIDGGGESGEEVGGSEALSNKHGWDSSNWTSAPEED